MDEVLHATTKQVVVDYMIMPTEADLYKAMSVYHWVEQNSSFYFDVNDPNTPYPPSGISIDATTGRLVLSTSEGLVYVNLGDYVMRDASGEFFSVSPSTFDAHYMPNS